MHGRIHPWLRALGLLASVTLGGAHAADIRTPNEAPAAPPKSLAAFGALNVDGNGVTDALTDGILLMRYVFGVRGDALVHGAIGPGAVRTTSAQIEAYLSTLVGTAAPIVAPGACAVHFAGPTVVPAYKDAAVGGWLDVQCATGDAPTQCTWNQGITSTACGVPFTPIGDATVTAVASNAGGSSPAASLLVREIDWTYWPIFCITHDSIQSVGWPSTGTAEWTTSALSTQTVAFRLTVPQNVTAQPTGVGTMRVASSPDAPAVPHDVMVSTGACDFRSGQYLFASIGAADLATLARFAVNNPTAYWQGGADFNLNSGDTVYVNIRNSTSGIPTCPAPSCNATVEWTPPAAQ